MIKFLAVALLALASAPAVAVMDYTTPGVENPVTYNFVSKGTELEFYFAGKDAAHTSFLGVFVNGVQLKHGNNTWVTPNFTTFVGQNVTFTGLNVGDEIEFRLWNLNTGKTFSSDPDSNFNDRNHIWSADWAGNAAVPKGTFVSFEDLQNLGDKDYNDFKFVFSQNIVPEPATWAMMITGFGLVGMSMRRKEKQRRAVIS
jgi:hypothetical protein